MDASAWVAGAVHSDSQAAELRRVMGTLRGRRIELFTTTWTLYEALAIVRRRKPEAVQLLFDRAVNNGSVIAVDPDVEHQALTRFLKWHDKRASVVDHANTLVAGIQRCEAIISFDKDFVPLAAADGMRLLS
jgi:predicted nucleic acid-binding protein